MQHILPILDRLLREHQLRGGVEDHAVLQKWSEVVGDQLAAWTRPLHVRDGTLWVLVESSTMIHHLTYIVPQILKTIRQTSPNSTIRLIRFTLRDWKPEP